MSAIKDIWAIVKMYFLGEKKKYAILMLLFCIFLELFMVYMQVQMNQAAMKMYNAVQDLNKDLFFDAILFYCFIIPVFIIVFVFRYYIVAIFELNWREWFTYKTLNRWTEKNTFYGLKAIDKEGDNPDQRISEDIKSFIRDFMSLLFGFISALSTIFAFIIILWQLSGSLNLFGIEIHGYLVWLTLIYAIISTYLLHMVGKSLAGLLFKQEEKEANFRYHMVRLRENAESVALYNAGKFENKNFRELFTQIFRNAKKLIVKNVHLGIFRSFYGSIGNILPQILIAPRLFAGEIKFGHMVQAADAFGRVNDAFSFIINSYTTIADLQACTARLTKFLESISVWQTTVARKELTINNINTKKEISWSSLKISLPTGITVLNSNDNTISKNTFISGKNGSGKSTLFRTIAGIWPFAKGNISFPKNTKQMFIPQKSYMPYGTFLDILAYPQKTKISKDKIKTLLKEFNLEPFISQLNNIDEWSRILSGGEQQKIAFIRAILYQPDFLFLDEATSNMDKTSIESLEVIIKKYLPKAQVLAISHDGKLLKNMQTLKLSQKTLKLEAIRN